MRFAEHMPIALLCLAFALITLLLPAQIISPAEQHQLVEMLNTAGFDSTDVNFLKDWDPTTKFKLSCQVEALNNPWKFIELLDKLKQTCSTYQDAVADSARRQGKVYPFLLPDFARYLDVRFPRVNEIDWFSTRFSLSLSTVKKPRDLFKILETQLFDFEPGKILDKSLSKEEQDSLSFWMYQAWQESEDSLAYKPFFADRFPNVKEAPATQRAIALLEKIDWNELNAAWKTWESCCRALENEIRYMKFSNKKPIYYKSRYGVMIIGSPGNDHYFDNADMQKYPVCFILEPGGNDTYDCSLFTDRNHPYYIVIDLKGDDVYRNSGIAKGMSVNNGIGWLHDYAGNDVYQYGDFAQSALLGFQYFRDEQGDDIYSSGLFSQAAAMFGISYLNDNAGNDTYTATEFAQGMGGPKGLGLLIDGKGNDVYYCGGKYLHAPLAPFDYRSMAQGFGFGFRPDIAGGIGILYDGEGNDRYSGGVYAQGVAYWYAIGALFDEKGNDYYDAVYYPQGSGIHLANGALVDMEGEDHYYSKHGPGQGNGHDWSVGVFVDKKGNDHYSVEGGNGLALANSVGIFIDSEGDDKYEHRNPSNYGFAAAARESGGLGLFLDAGGKDSYPDTLQANNKTWQNGTYGIGRDIELNIPEISKLEKLAEQETADVDSLASIETLFAVASEWEVGSAAKRVKLAREYLLNRETEAVPYAINMKMGTKSGLEYRTLSELATKSELMRTSLYTVLHDADSLKVKNSIALIAEQGDSLAVDSLAVFLNQNKYIPTVLSALGGIKSQRSLELILPWTAHQTEKYRYLAARSLKALNSDASLTELRKMASDSSFLIKAMVRQLPVKQETKK